MARTVNEATALRTIIMSFNFGGFQARNMIEWGSINQVNHVRILEHVKDAAAWLHPAEVKARVEILYELMTEYMGEGINGKKQHEYILCAKCIELLGGTV